MASIVASRGDRSYLFGRENRTPAEVRIEQDSYAVREDLLQRSRAVRRQYFAAQEREQLGMRLAKAPLGSDTLRRPGIAAIIRHQRRHRAGWMF